MSVGSRTRDAPWKRKQKEGSARTRRETWYVGRGGGCEYDGFGLSLKFQRWEDGADARVRG